MGGKGGLSIGFSSKTIGAVGKNPHGFRLDFIKFLEEVGNDPDSKFLGNIETALLLDTWPIGEIPHMSSTKKQNNESAMSRDSFYVIIKLS